MDAVPAEDREKNIKDHDLTVDDLPVKRSLGLRWDIMADIFVFKVVGDCSSRLRVTGSTLRENRTSMLCICPSPGGATVVATNFIRVAPPPRLVSGHYEQRSDSAAAVWSDL